MPTDLRGRRWSAQVGAPSSRLLSRTPVVRSARLAGALGGMLGLAVTAPYAIQAAAPLRPVVVAVLATIVTVELATSRRWHVLLGPFLMAAPAVVLLAAAVSLPTEVATAGLQRYLTVLPLGLLAGWLVQQSASRRSFGRGLVVVAVISAVVAVAEALLGTSFLGRNYLYFVENGHARGMAAADHPLVLGVILVVCIPVAAACWRGRLRVLVVAALAAGVLATGSVGPVAVGAVVVLVSFWPRLSEVLGRQRRLLYLVAATALVGLGLLSTRVWTAEAGGATSGNYSSSYRTAMYSLVPEMLRDAPWGYGVGSLPPGRWLILSEYKGVRDLAVTLDSEVVYLVSEWGYVGIALFLTAVVLGIRAFTRQPLLGLVSLAMTLSGLFLAVHTWDTLGALWAGSVGMCLATGRPGPGHVPAPDPGAPTVGGARDETTLGIR